VLRGIFSRLGLIAEGKLRSPRAAEARSHVSSNSTNWAQMFGDSESSTGVAVTPETALRTAAVFACVNVISGTIGTLPARVYRRLEGGGREQATEHPLYSLLHDAPNDLLTSCEFREMMQAHLCLRGNAYARIVRDGSGAVSYIDPFHPDRVSMFKRGRVVTYSVQRPEGGGQDILRSDEMLDKKALELMRTEWERSHGGIENANKTAILFGGLKYSGVSMSNEDAQFLETRKFQVTDIARIFRVPPHKIGDLGQATFSNIEHQSIEFVTDCIRPWVVRWEQRMNQVLLTPIERKEYYIELSLDALLRGDTISRYGAYKVGREAGFLSANDIRDRENMNRIEGGDSYMQPMNFTRLGEFSQPDSEQANQSTE
jgi:phage portal protein BeeE